MLIIWLQGIWLPQHGYDFSQTPLWAGIYMIPLTIGFLVSGPVSGIVADRYGARGIATIGLIGAGCLLLVARTLAHGLQLSALRRHHPVLLAVLRHVLLAQPDGAS